MKLFLLLTILAALPALAEDPKISALIRHGDAEEKQGHAKAALADFRAAEELDAKNVGVLLRISKAYSDLVDATKPPEAAEQLAHKSLDYAQRALDLDPKIAKAHLSRAIAYGKLTDFVGNKTKLEYSKIIKEETAKSIELDPTDDFAWYVLGRWHAGVANVSGMLRVLAKVVYGGMPAASNEDAVKCLKKATELAPQRTMSLLLEGVLLPTAEERAELRAHFAPPVVIAGDGSHWFRTWQMIRDMGIWWPWFRPAQAALRRVAADFDAASLHQRTCETLRQPGGYGAYVAAALDHDAASALNRLQVTPHFVRDSLNPVATAYAAEVRRLCPAAEWVE